MAEPVNYFLQGASLGMNAAQFGINQQRRSEEFRTNLAENARQFDANFDLQRTANNAAVARDNAYTRKLEFDLLQAQEEDDLNTTELASLRDYLTTIRTETANGVIDLSLPPSNLTGQNLTTALSYREKSDQSRQLNEDYKQSVRDRKELRELVNDYDLDPKFIAYQRQYELAQQTGDFSQLPYMPSGQDEIRAAKLRRSTRKADSIASLYGVSLTDNPAIPFDINQFVNNRGDLNEDGFEAYVRMRPDATKEVKSRTTTSTGTTQETISNKLRDNSEAKLFVDQMEAALRAARNEDGTFDTAAANAVLEAFKTGVIPDFDGDATKDSKLREALKAKGLLR